MNKLQNLHTHCSFCDGKNPPEDVVLTALEKGFASIGFSSHSYMYFTPSHMSLPATEEYKREIARLKKKYADRIEIFCGLEVDLYSKVDLSEYDYLIGSVHYLRKGAKFLDFDRNAEPVQKIIAEDFDGDGLAYAKAYYELLGTLPEYGNFDIIGHFDLIAKHSETHDFFDTESQEYLRAAFDAVDALKGKIPFFEVNTGAIARGYRTTPYPSIPILKRLLEAGFLPVISSDCHDMTKLDCAFEAAAALLEYCGAKEQYILTKNGFRSAALR